MCGIAGIRSHSVNWVDPKLIGPMLSTITHRGPDDAGIWSHGRYAMGQQRLKIIDYSVHAGQPMLTTDQTGVITYNGEVYNYKALRQDLEKAGIEFQSTGDTEVVLQALNHWGPEIAIPKFNGMFSLAYLDRRSDTLWLARDRVGIKPLMVADTGSELIFASESRALLAHPNLPRKINLHDVSLRLDNAYVGSHTTLYENIEGLEPGYWWRIDDTGIKKHCYFHVLRDLDIDRLVAAQSIPPESLVDDFASLLKQSVELHLASDAPLAAMVSGGVDSSLIAAYAKEHRTDIQGYVADTISSDSEGDQAARVCKHLGMPLKRIKITPELYLHLWPTAIWHHDDVPWHPSDPALLAVTQQCHRDGIKVLLTGEGSDELFGGYPWHYDTWRQWRKLESPLYKVLHRKKCKKMMQKLQYRPFLHNESLNRRSLFSTNADLRLLPRRILELLNPIQPASDRAFLANGFTNLYDHLSWILYRHDRMGMASSMEMRVPFLENNLFDFAFHLPTTAKLQGNTGKWLVKREAERHLPKEVVHAPKKGFPVPGELTKRSLPILCGGMLQELMKWSKPSLDDLIAILAGNDRLRYQVVSLELWLRLSFTEATTEQIADLLITNSATQKKCYPIRINSAAL